MAPPAVTTELKPGESRGVGTTIAKAPLPDDPKSRALMDRITAYWEAKIKRDFASAYLFQTPKYRENHSAEVYAQRFGGMVKWFGASIDGIQFREDGGATVFVLVDHSFANPFSAGEIRNKIRISEDWVMVDEAWYRLIPQASVLDQPEQSSFTQAQPPEK
jgi:hypothetical protein